MNRNCITHWLPRIEGHVPTPKTEIVRLDLDRERRREFWAPLDGKPAPKWFDGWLETLREAALRISKDGPWFLRTGDFSGKHNWRECCGVYDLSRLGHHVYSLFEFSQIVDFMGLPYDVWCVREWLHGPVLLEYEPFGGMPIRREFRAFAEAGDVKCVHPYWPAMALDDEVSSTTEFAEMNAIGDDETAVREMAAEASRHVDGEWSIDCLWTDRGWYVTDMAVASMSFHWEDCPRLSERKNGDG